MAANERASPRHRPSPLKYLKTDPSPEIIRLAAMLYIRLPLSFRNVEDLLHERGIEISHETVRCHYNTRRPHSSLGYRPPAPEVIQWPASPSGTASPATPAVAIRQVMH